jgi:serine-type D-Ala-D-Ala carboxypeptidase (penicillin-binding protein 5/6)
VRLAPPALVAAALLWLWPGAPRAAAEAPPDRFPRAGGAYLVAVDGAVVWARSPDAPRPPASLTKIMTALLALESGVRPDAWLRVSPRAARETGSRAGLRAGEELTVSDALTATLVSSSNDACLALAEHVGGSVPTFVARMNARARELGLGATRFENPCGHDAAGHVSSARDLLALTRTALAIPEFQRLVALERTTITTRKGRAIPLRTHNLLLGRFEGAVGVKSGYTGGAGPCMVALARRRGVEALVVLLDAPDRWWTVAALLEAAFEEGRPHG